MGAYSFYHFQRYIFSKFIIHQKTKMKEHCSNECLQFSRGGGGRGRLVEAIIQYNTLFTFHSCTKLHTDYYK